MTIQQDWGTGYNAHVFAVNPLPVTAKTWQIIVDLKGGTINGGPWGALVNNTTGIVTFTPTGPTIAIPAGQTNELFLFNSSATVGGPRAVIAAYNFQMDVFKTCETNYGLNPTKAALAVAMATELGRWEPDLDLVVNTSTWKVQLASSAVCIKNSCGNTKALLGQQDYTPDQNIFSNVGYQNDLYASFQRQKDLINNLTLNNKAALPISNYKLTLVGGPTNMGYGACGPHYVYQVDYSSGTNSGKPLSATDATNLVNTLCFFGGGECGGGNPYLGVLNTGITGCPSGKRCIAIDPGDGDNGSASTTTAGSAPSYPFNRVYDPTNSLLGSQCITTGGLLGKMTSKCSFSPNTCGTLYCIAN